MKKLARSVLKSVPPIYRGYNRLRGWRIGSPDTKLGFIDVGGDGGEHNYGAWVVPEGLLDTDSIVYSIGIGEDVSFDLSLIEKFDCVIWAYDPTPAAIKFISSRPDEPKLKFHAIGLSSADGVATFAGPSDSDPSFSFSEPTAEKASVTHSFPVARLATLMMQNGHRNIDLLKMDIEGFEYSVIDDMLASKIRPICIIVEFHHFQRRDPEATRAAVRKLKAAGYRNFWISDLGAEYGFAHSDWITLQLLQKKKPADHHAI